MEHLRLRRRATAAAIAWCAPVLLVSVHQPPSIAAPPMEPDRVVASVDELLAASNRSLDDGRRRYIVEVDDPGSLDSVVAEHEADGVDVIHGWDEAVPGFAAALSPTEVARLSADPDVVGVSIDHVVGVDSVTQPFPPWGLDRIDQRDPPLDASYSYTSTGDGVTAYVVDTGIRTTHVEFTGRIAPGAFIDFGDGLGVEDCNGHGTHVSGTLGGTTSGVAKGVRIVPVKTFDCGGSAFVSDVIAGLSWIIADHGPGVAAVVNMSLGTDVAAPLLDAAVDSVIADGIAVVVAAGNASIPACNVSPARVPDAITVAATNIDDSRASYSNTGTCNDLFAPGTGIVSAGITSNTATAVKNGTSMAAPHVAGVIARLLEDDPLATPTQVTTSIITTSDPGVIGRATGDRDRILYAAPEPPSCVSPPAGIIAWWSGNGDVTAQVGTPLTGDAAFAPGVVGDGFAFDGRGWLSATGVPTGVVGFTFEAWTLPVRSPTVQTLAAKWDFPSTDDAARTFAVSLYPDDRLVVEIDETSARRPETLSARVPSLRDGAPHHIAVTWDQARIAIHVDGVETAAGPSQGGTLNPSPTVPITIGGQVRGFPSATTIDEPTLYSRALSGAEIASVHRAGTAGKCRSS